jgi:hypothetical protein
MSSNFNCSYMARNSLTYIPDCSLTFFFQGKSSHFEWRAELSGTLLKRDDPRTIPVKFALTWFSVFRGEDFFKISSPFFLICIIGQNRQKFKVHFKIVSVSAVLYSRWPPLLKIEISSNGQNCSILSQNVPTFEL